MRKTGALLVLVLIGIALLVSNQGEAVSRGIQVVAKGGKQLYLYKDYHALVVGVSDYDKWPDLPNAVKDAQEVSSALKRLGVKVTLVSNPTSQELKDALNDLTYKMGREKNRALIVYYAGHGETEALADGTKLGYIIPRDCPLLRDDPEGFVNRAVSMKDIESYSLRMRSKHVLMLFDSCFSGSLFSLVRALPEDICEKSARPVRQYITAGTENEAVPDKSMFKRCLLLGLEGDADLTRDGYVTGTELGMYLSDKVVQSTSRAQHPQYGKIRTPELSRGDFIFQLASSAAVVEEPSREEGQATLSVECDVSGAKVFLDNRSLGITPLTDAAVSPGDHTVRVEKDGYEPYRKSMLLEAGRSITLHVTLSEERPENGRLFVETQPEDARITILNIGPTFYQGMELEPGRYHVEVSAAGYKTKKKWIEIVAGGDKHINIHLAKLRIAVCDVQHIIESSVVGVRASDEMKRQGKKMEGTLKAKGDEIKELRKTVDEKRRAMSNDARDAKEQEIRDKISDLKSLQKRYQDILKELNLKLSKEITREVFQITDELAEREGYRLVVGKHYANKNEWEKGVMYRDPGDSDIISGEVFEDPRDTVDITEQVLQLYDAMDRHRTP